MKDDELDDLLSGGRFSGPRRDALRERVLQSTQRRRRAWVWPSLAFALTAAAALLVVVARPSDDGFGVRGTASTAHLQAIALPSRIAFEIANLKTTAYFAAYAEGPERTWFFPAPDGTTPAVAPTGEPRVLPEAVSVAAGTYRVVTLLFAKPVTRAEALAKEAEATRSVVTITVAP